MEKLSSYAVLLCRYVFVNPVSRRGAAETRTSGIIRKKNFSFHNQANVIQAKMCLDPPRLFP
jgi:hypothetical protein